MKCKIRGHKRGEQFVYSGGGLVLETCSRCWKVLDAVAVEDFEYGGELLDFVAESVVPT